MGVEEDLDKVLDLIDEIEIDLETRAEKIAAYEDLVSRLRPGSEGWAEALTGLSDHRQHTGDPQTALELLESVRDSGVQISPSIEVHLFSLHLAMGNEAEAMAIEGELRRLSRNTDLGQDYGWIGESFEEEGRLREALRWYSMANRDIDPDDFEALEKQSLSARWRVRQTLGLPEDAYDVSARQWQEMHAQRRHDS